MKESKKELLKIIINIKSIKFLERFLRDILTPTEFKEIIRRWQVVELLSRKIPHYEISQKFRIGRATISRGSRILANKNSSFNKVLEKKK